MENNKQTTNNDKIQSNSDFEGVYDSASTASSEDSAVCHSLRYRSFSCPYCRFVFTVVKAEIGKCLICPDCDTEVMVPSDLDFETETDFEKRYFNKEEKLLRDKAYSPLRNPNRTGLLTEGDNVYTLKDSESASTRDVDNEIYYHVRCRICETVMSFPSYMLGKRVSCPDCETENIVTDVMKKQQSVIDSQFKPLEHSAHGIESVSNAAVPYDIGEVPEDAKVAIQYSSGKIVIIDPKENTIAPSMPSTAKSSEEDNPRLAPSENAQRISGNDNSSLLFLKKRKEKQSKKKFEEPEDLANYLPPMVLRSKNGELVWALPSPPKAAPLFNRTFRAIFSGEVWTRGIFLALLLLIVALAMFYWVIPVLKAPLVGEDRGAGEKLYTLLVMPIIGVSIFPLMTFLWTYFTSIYDAGNCGAFRVINWRKEDFLDYIGRGLWFMGMIGLCMAPGLVLLIALEWLNVSLTIIPVLFGSFWLFFPIFWLSTAQSGWLFCPITWDVYISFFKKGGLWIQFYLFSFVFFYIPSVLWGALAWDKLFFLLTPIVIPLGAMFYGLFLGRLSWIIEDELRDLEYED